MCVLCTEYLLSQWYNKEKTILNQVWVTLLSEIKVQSTLHGLAELRDGPKEGYRDEWMGQ